MTGWTEQNWDRERDERKNYVAPEAGGLTSTPINAMEVAVLVKALPVVIGAALIDRYVSAEFERIRLEAVAAGARP